ncbi:hypothetical protein POPTR_008G124350v4 [Populus trichocarpa]|uniref:Uncharacterized protein n=1 Tax=Populus trichocarpa TaxID=3694 RepID=A0ACC0SL78_POPTR|nr:hypothetical protein POPTR_008G124350v4 [Populus trichocarpa]
MKKFGSGIRWKNYTVFLRGDSQNGNFNRNIFFSSAVLWWFFFKNSYAATTHDTDSHFCISIICVLVRYFSSVKR